MFVSVYNFLKTAAGRRVSAALMTVLSGAAFVQATHGQQEKTDVPAGNVAAAVRAFSNTTPVNIPSSGGAASAVTVSGMSGPVSRLTVTLNGVVHLTPADLDFLLVGPHGEQLVILSDAGGAFGLSDSVIRLSDYNTTLAPANASIGNGLVDYKPTNYGSFDTFTGIAGFPPEVGPGGFETLSSVFDGIDPNGVWTLFVEDDTAGGNGANSRLARGWSLTIETPETLQVTTFADTDDGFCDAANCTLREAVKYSTNGSTIIFPGVNPFAVVLARDPITVDKRLTFTDFGTVGGGPRVFITGNNATGVLNVTETGDLTLNGIGISGGVATNAGAGIFSRGSLTLNGCVVRGNRIVSSGAPVTGAGIVSFGNLKMTTTTVADNDLVSDRQRANGAGIFIGRGPAATRPVEIVGSIIRNNRVIPESGFSTATLTGGGLALAPQSAVIIRESSIFDNFAGDSGGGVTIDQGALTLINTTITGNSSLSSIVDSTPFAASRLTAINSTIAANHPIFGCALNGASADFTIRNTIVAGNPCDLDSVVSAGNNLVSRPRNFSALPTDIVTPDHGLGAFGNYGGLIPFIPLQSNSPAIDAGSDCVLRATDAGGCTPQAAGTDSQLLPRNLGDGVDIGAAEFNFLPPGARLASGRRALTPAETTRPYALVITALFGTPVASVNASGFDVPGLTIAPVPNQPAQLAIAGVPTTPGSYDFTVTATSAGGLTVSADYTLEVRFYQFTIGGRVTDPAGRGIAGAVVTLTAANGQSFAARTNSFGGYAIPGLPDGQTYACDIRSKGYTFVPQTVVIDGARGDLDFVLSPAAGAP
ncbi:MAG: carboxypeptidase regulatory-like domain-containing protein [Acidobacteria bacterium]|nr:carboxypeptidase regulatory-like domain-containing protein [Acidobacteriota bacterium]